MTVYERDQKARKQCLLKWWYKCVVCNMTFKDIYGPIGTEFIHVHHLKPLYQNGKSYQVDGQKDLRPVCPNCHAMHHHGPSPPTIEELREYMVNASSMR